MENKREHFVAKENVLKSKSYAFALSVVRFYKYLIENKKEFVLAKQLLRSGTSIGALIEEANQAESKLDFIHKLSIANKEANETGYWLRLLRDGKIVEEEAKPLLNDCDEIIRIITASIKSSKSSLEKNKNGKAKTVVG